MSEFSWKTALVTLLAAAVIAALQVFAFAEFESITDWRVWFVGLGAQVGRYTANALLVYLVTTLGRFLPSKSAEGES